MSTYDDILNGGYTAQQRKVAHRPMGEVSSGDNSEGSGSSENSKSTEGVSTGGAKQSSGKQGWGQQPLWQGAQKILDEQDAAGRPSIPQPNPVPSPVAPSVVNREGENTPTPTNYWPVTKSVEEVRQQQLKDAGWHAPMNAPVEKKSFTDNVAEHGWTTAVNEDGKPASTEIPKTEISDAEIAANKAVSHSSLAGGYKRDPRYEKSMEEIIAALDEDAAQEKQKFSPEEIERQRKRQRNRAMIAGIGDVVSAFANMYYTTKGSPNVKQASPNLSDRVAARMEKIKADQDAARKNYLNVLLKKYGVLKDADKAKADAAALASKEQREGIKLAIEAKKAEKEGRLKDAQALNALALAKLNGSKAEAQDIENEWLPKEKEAGLARTKAQTKAANASAANSLASAGEHNARTGKIQQETREGRKGKTIVVHNGANDSSMDVFVPEKKWNIVNVGHLYQLLGGQNIQTRGEQGREGSKDYKAAVTRRPTMAEMEQYIGKRMLIGTDIPEGAILFLDKLSDTDK